MKDCTTLGFSGKPQKKRSASKTKKLKKAIMEFDANQLGEQESPEESP